MNCVVNNCDRLKTPTTSYCKAHQRRLRLKGDLLVHVPLPPQRPLGQCILEDCEKVEDRQGLCYAHYKQCRLYNLSVDELQALLRLNDGICPICQHRQATHIDHDHSCCRHGGSCGKCVRGVLCDPCNRALGFLRDDVDAIGRAASYLEASRSKAIVAV